MWGGVGWGLGRHGLGSDEAGAGGEWTGSPPHLVGETRYDYTHG